MTKHDPNLPVTSPEVPGAERFTDPAAAVARLDQLYRIATRFLRKHFEAALAGEVPDTRFRAFYPEVRITTTSFASVDSRLSFGHVAEPGTYATTVTRPDLFRNYLTQQLRLLMENHGVDVLVGASSTPMPVHFAVAGDEALIVPGAGSAPFTLRDVFDVPDLSTTNDEIVNGYGFTYPDGAGALAPFTAQRVDYSLAR
ncbi:MAG: AMP nucleosidase, partial [Pseudomonadota bacterium]